MQAVKCPCCGASFNPNNNQCEYCQSYIIVSEKNYVDLSKVDFNIIENSDKNPGIYVFGTLLGKGEVPINLGVANYFKGFFFALGGKLLLTNKTLSFSSHTLMQDKTTLVIQLKDVENATLVWNWGISQIIGVTASGKKYKFVVYHGKEWIQKIMEAAKK